MILVWPNILLLAVQYTLLKSNIRLKVLTLSTLHWWLQRRKQTGPVGSLYKWLSVHDLLKIDVKPHLSRGPKPVKKMYNFKWKSFWILNYSEEPFIENYLLVFLKQYILNIFIIFFSFPAGLSVWKKFKIIREKLFQHNYLH